MQLSTFFISVIMPLAAMADTHASCKCNGDDLCTSRACNGYASGQKFFNIPTNAVGPPTSQPKDGRCYSIFSDNTQFLVFEGLGGNEFKAECLKACNSGSSCS
ncbi:hypothetical protein CGMCC3_g17834 [Colletotrichum fructicola]|nr:uncharacterized protein CGMCC3_g17834 [Colletotrichum fructicola]KAE9565985.1 hypothetical protein CGMCC3_g17834 [Colletotrichum fructicola]KAK1853597.1 hypothetical protein CCHR01_03806 [Colletotrichum chrysophilum]